MGSGTVPKCTASVGSDRKYNVEALGKCGGGLFSSEGISTIILNG